MLNADSMQVYRDLRIITARPSAEEESSVPHVLFGTVDGSRAYSVSQWLIDMARELERARTTGLLPIVVGGTGLYLKALTQGLSDIPEVPEAVRVEVRAWAEGRPSPELHQALAACDPIMAARLRPTDPQRIVRALEVQRATGRSLAAYHDRRRPPVLCPQQCRAIRLAPDRRELISKIDRRLDRMISEGALGEIQLLQERKLDPAMPVTRALGVPPLMEHLRVATSLGHAVETAKGDTRRYIRRQDTFARHQLPAFHPLAPERAEEELLAQL